MARLQSSGPLESSDKLSNLAMVRAALRCTAPYTRVPTFALALSQLYAVHCTSVAYTDTDTAYVWLLEELVAMTQQERSAFLSFITSSPRLPPGGLGQLPKGAIVVRASPPFPACSLATRGARSGHHVWWVRRLTASVAMTAAAAVAALTLTVLECEAVALVAAWIQKMLCCRQHARAPSNCGSRPTAAVSSWVRCCVWH